MWLEHHVLDFGAENWNRRETVGWGGKSTVSGAENPGVSPSSAPVQSATSRKSLLPGSASPTAKGTTMPSNDDGMKVCGYSAALRTTNGGAQ